MPTDHAVIRRQVTSRSRSSDRRRRVPPFGQQDPGRQRLMLPTRSASPSALSPIDQQSVEPKAANINIALVTLRRSNQKSPGRQGPEIQRSVRLERHSGHRPPAWRRVRHHAFYAGFDRYDSRRRAGCWLVCDSIDAPHGPSVRRLGLRRLARIQARRHRDTWTLRRKRIDPLRSITSRKGRMGITMNSEASDEDFKPLQRTASGDMRGE